MPGIRTVKRKNALLTKLTYKKWYKSTTTFIKSKPLSCFFIALGLLFLVILVGHLLNQPKQHQQVIAPTKIVKLYSIGSAPKATFQAKIEKAGVIKIVAQTAGIVLHVNVTDGANVTQYQRLLSLATNYQGDNAPAIQAQIAEAQYKNVQDTFSQQQDAINKQKDIANINHDNFTDQQAIATQSANNTNSLINSNQTLLDSLNQQLSNAQNSGADQTTITGLQAQINQLQGGQNQLRQSLSTLQEQTDSSKPPGRLADSQRDLAIEQLNIQEKALELNKEITGLQAALAEVNEDTMNPASPVDGVVERIFVHEGQSVSPGMQLATITTTANDPQTIAIADVPQQIAQNISKFETSDIYLNGKAYHLKPFFISTDATNGMLYSIFYKIPTDDTSLVTDGQYINVAIPIGKPNTSAALPFVPIDAVYQTQDSNYLLIDEHNKAVSRQVSLGNVFGSFVEITNGLHFGDQVILDRNVLDGDSVKTE